MAERRTEVATLGGGCFWCLEPLFKALKGVDGAVSGYAGGHVDDPSYREVCNGNTGHAEVVQITFDPDVIAFADLLDVFFTMHDPTTPNRQGADVGPQYRSIVLTASPEQEATARTAVARAGELWGKPAVTQIVPLTRFWPAEAYHQDYFENNPGQGYCRVVIAPKVAKFRQKYLAKLKA
ncbi:MAG: peptide-methionine (S)-S-oxide reductase MsrA [Geminicoccaceae bacterium]